MKTLFTLAFSLISTLALAQNPCTAVKPLVSIVSAISNVTTTMSDYNQVFNGQPVITDLDVLVVQQGADPATGTPVIPIRNVVKTLWTLVAGTVDCYQTPASFLVTVTPNTTFDLWVRSNGPAGKGPWQGGSGALPFGFRSVPGARTGVRATQ